ncbi:MAG: hypothetical protein V4702_02510 [Patescibacteria group bacterium]
MALTINAPKNILLIPFFVVLVIIAIPFALFFSLIRLPFAKRRIDKLQDMLKNDWMPRKKYMYIGLNSNFALSDFVKDKIIRNYGEHIVWDEWNEKQKEWRESEPDNSRRVTTFWQDIGGDFDGDPMIIIATYQPDDFVISNNKNFYQFWLYEDDRVNYNDEKLKTKEAEKKIEAIVEKALDSWR